MVRPICRAGLGFLLLGAMGISRAVAQSYWSDDRERTVIRFEAVHGFFDGGGFKFPTGTLLFEGSTQAGRSFRVDFDLPFSVVRLEGTPGLVEGGTHAKLGNPYIGLRFHKEGRAFTGQVGVRLPLEGDFDSANDLVAFGAAILVDPDRLEAYIPKTMTFKAAGEYRKVSPGGLLLGAKFGGSLLKDTEGGDPELFLDYGGRIGYEGSGVRATAGLTGRLLVTESGSFDERSQHTVHFGADLARGTVRPGVLLRVPLDDNPLQTALGFRLSVVP